MRPIKVAHVTTIDLSLRLLLLNQLRSLAEAGYDVTGISAAGPHVPAVEAAGIRHLAVEMTRTFTPAQDAVALLRLARLMRRERFDIVHTHNPKPGLLGQLAARLARVPIVVNTLHGFYFHDGMSPKWRRFYIATEKIAAACSDVILSQNPEDIETALAEGIARPQQIKWLGNGIDLRRFDRARIDPAELAAARRQLGLQEGRPVIGFVGRLVAEKGILELMAAALIVLQTRPDAQFLIVGPLDREKHDALTPAIAAEYGVAHACTFAGLREDMPAMMALMDVFVLPSHREGFPRSPMEASAMGVPCVVTDIRGCRETVRHGKTGWLTPLGDAGALADAIAVLLQNPALAAAMGAQARAQALSEFDERRVFARVQDEYARLAAEKLGRAVPQATAAPVEIGKG